MLCVNTYTKDYVNSCRSKIEAQLAACRVLAGEAREKAGDSSASAATFEPLFFNNLVLVLDRFFVHRARALEGKDGNPLNEVRMLCDSILQKDGVMTADKTIKFDPAKSVLRLQPGDEIRLSDSEADFVRLSNAFFARDLRRDGMKRFVEGMDRGQSTLFPECPGAPLSNGGRNGRYTLRSVECNL